VEKAKGETMAVPANGEAGGNIDQIRDIIFGAQMRDYEQRFARLEERLLKASADLRDDVAKRLQTLEQYIKKETEALGTDLKAEQKTRGAELRALGAELADSDKGTDQRFAKLEDVVTKGQRELRGLLLDQSKSLAEEIQRRHGELSTALKQESSELRGSKTDRAALAGMLAEMAKRLTDEIKKPEHGGKRE
jgi:DNA anti-recombination protein RmuC